MRLRERIELKTGAYRNPEVMLEMEEQPVTSDVWRTLSHQEPGRSEDRKYDILTLRNTENKHIWS